jgi:endonuclease YncB( thermonuclease family)
MAVQRQRKGASHRGAPFALGLALFLLLALPARATQCDLAQDGDAVSVAYVYDGDTVRLNDGRKVRFIGINTPEIDHDGGRSEPYAHAARRRLQQLLGEEERLLLRYGNERHDRYGRTLAHPYLEDGRSVNALLLQAGLATTLVVPPNVTNHHCYHAVETRARQQGLGVWSLPRYQVRTVDSLKDGEEGYRLISGTVTRVAESRRSLWIELEGPLALRIPRRDLRYFAESDLQGMAGAALVARGWLHFDQGRWRMTVRHPAAIERH